MKEQEEFRRNNARPDEASGTVLESPTYCCIVGTYVERCGAKAHPLLLPAPLLLPTPPLLLPTLHTNRRSTHGGACV